MESKRKSRLSAKQRILVALCRAWPQSLRLAFLMEIGGTSAHKRMSELKNDHGIDIDFTYEFKDGIKTNTTRYFLIPDPQNVYIYKLCLRS